MSRRRLGDRPGARLGAFSLALAVTFGAGWGLGEATHDDRGVKPPSESPAEQDHGGGGHR